MRSRDLAILLIVLVGLVGVYLIVRQPLAPAGRGIGADAGALLPRFQPETVTSIVLGSGPESLALVSEEGVWMIAGNPRRFAERARVDHALGMLAALTREELVSIVPDKHVVFEVDRVSGRRVVLLAGADTLAALFIGKPGPSGLDSYVRLADEDEVYLSPRGLAASVPRRPEHWRDRVVLPFDPNDVTTISVDRGGLEIVLERGGAGSWTAREPEEFLADSGACDRLLLTMADLRAVGFADDISLSEAGLDIEGGQSPVATVEAGLESGMTAALWIGSRTDDAYYARRPDRTTVYLLSPRTVDFMLGDPSVYRPTDKGRQDDFPPNR